ncbi:MAG: hypothetical protein WC828_02470 [Thermoleophilia bacterium]|jgi:hypothetical protein
MKVVNPIGSGPRGRLFVLAAGVVVLLVGMALIWGGCGDSANQGTSGSQLDDEGSGGSTSSDGSGGSGEGNAMVDYSFDQCTSDMTKRYGDVEKAKQVCGQLQADYSSQPISQLATILPTVEKNVGATPLPGSTIPGSSTGGTGGQTGGGTSTNGGGTTTGPIWPSDGIEIVVPPAP